MDLMGSDALQSEDAVRQMWGDSMKAVKCQHARITYEDFLLLMKGQSKDSPSQELDRDLVGTNVSSLMVSSHLYVVPEAEPQAGASSLLGTSASSLLGSPLYVVPEAEAHPESPPPKDVLLLGEQILTMEEFENPEDSAPGLDMDEEDDSTHTPVRISPRPPSGSHSAPGTPAGHIKHMLDLEDMDSPLSLDEEDEEEEDNVQSAGPGVPGTSASLTPPSSPVRGARDFVTPMTGRRMQKGVVEEDLTPNLVLPGLIARPDPYTRRRSRSMDEKDGNAEKDGTDLHVVADVTRHMIVPETGHAMKQLDAVVKDSTKSALVVNRQLYRAHRQMRLAVLEASKRFEEEQAKHAREVILAQREAEGKEKESMGMIQAGLVMRHGQKVSSEAIRNVLRENQSQQQGLVEKANKRGGRGRRSRKKTISDMSGMLSSLGQEEMGLIAATASASSPEPPPVITESVPVVDDVPLSIETDDVNEIPDIFGNLRDATVPGEFRRTSDPFGREGRYGAVLAQWDRDRR
jgi:hypothetical protein